MLGFQGVGTAAYSWLACILLLELLRIEIDISPSGIKQFQFYFIILDFDGLTYKQELESHFHSVTLPLLLLEKFVSSFFKYKNNGTLPPDFLQRTVINDFAVVAT